MTLSTKINQIIRHILLTFLIYSTDILITPDTTTTTTVAAAAAFSSSSSSSSSSSHHTNTPPELIVQSQLDALKNDDMYNVFQYASPANKAATGPWNTRFSQMVRSPPYAPLVRHDRAVIIMTIKKSDNRWRCLVRVWPRIIKQQQQQGELGSVEELRDLMSSSVYEVVEDDDGERRRSVRRMVEYWWGLSRCKDDGGPLDGCWMVDNVVPR